MHGVSFIHGLQLPPISMILEKLGAVAVPDSRGGHMLIRRDECRDPQHYIEDYVRTDPPNNRIVLRNPKGSFVNDFKYLGPLETVMCLACDLHHPAPYADAFRWIVRNIEGYECYGKWPQLTSVPIVGVDWDKDMARDELQAIFADVIDSPLQS